MRGITRVEVVLVRAGIMDTVCMYRRHRGYDDTNYRTQIGQHQDHSTASSSNPHTQHIVPAHQAPSQIDQDREYITLITHPSHPPHLPILAYPPTPYPDQLPKQPLLDTILPSYHPSTSHSNTHAPPYHRLTPSLFRILCAFPRAPSPHLDPTRWHARSPRRTSDISSVLGGEDKGVSPGNAGAGMGWEVGGREGGSLEGVAGGDG